ncbi:MAG: MFS transporter [Spirochaetes bacterium]|nr:MAG: MFS transporter [Spirochaetota bacterium]
MNTGTQVKKFPVLIMATMVSFITPFISAAVNIALPMIGEQFGMDAMDLGWVASSFLLAAAAFLVPFGRIADIYGRKKIFTIGMWLYTASALGAVFAWNAASLILFRALQGLGSAMVFGNALAILTSVFPPKERGRVIGVSVAAVYLGLSMGPFLGGLLAHYAGWHSIFLVMVPMGLAVILMVYRYLPAEWAESKGERFDAAGSVLYVLGLIFMMYGFSRLPAPGAAGLTAAGFALLVVFVIWEKRVKFPVLHLDLFWKNTAFAMSNLAALINYCATFAVGFLLSLYLQYIKGMGPREAGIVLVAQPVIMALFSPFAGRLSDRIEPRVVSSIGMALTTAGLGLLTFVREDTPLWFIIACLVVLGFGFAFFSSPNTNAVMSSVESRQYGVASGTIGTMRLVGQMLSMGIAMLIFALFVGHAKIGPENHPQFLQSMKLAFGIFAVMCGAGIYASLARGKIR